MRDLFSLKEARKRGERPGTQQDLQIVWAHRDSHWGAQGARRFHMPLLILGANRMFQKEYQKVTPTPKLHPYLNLSPS